MINLICHGDKTIWECLLIKRCGASNCSFDKIAAPTRKKGRAKKTSLKNGDHIGRLLVK